MNLPALENEAAPRDAGLLVLRVVVGGIFLVHGLDKLIDLSATESYFASLDIPAPGLMAPFVGATEAVGGVLVLLGLGTRLVGLALAGDMLVALLTEHIGDGFFVDEGGVEFVLLLGSASLALVLTGAGRLSLDSALGVTRHLFELVTRQSHSAPGRTDSTKGTDRRPHGEFRAIPPGRG